MAGQLSKVPATEWIQGTIAKMNRDGVDDRRSWAERWAATYFELGGKKLSLARKACPRSAAYGLWQLGRIREGGRRWDDVGLARILREHSTNTAYAVLALQLLDQDAQLRGGVLWARVRAAYRQHFPLEPEPAEGEEGEVRLACILFDEDQIVTRSPAST